MGNRADMVRDLGAFIAEKILKQPGRSVHPEEPLISSGLIDSFSLVDLALEIERVYGVVVDDTELNADTFDSLLALAELIESRL